MPFFPFLFLCNDTIYTFDDDRIIFCKVDMATNVHLQNLLKDYAQDLGQLINQDKTSMIISKNVRRQVKDEIIALWGLTEYT